MDELTRMVKEKGEKRTKNFLLKNGYYHKKTLEDKALNDDQLAIELLAGFDKWVKTIMLEENQC